ncbi:MAG: hypothetical protein AB1540_12450 [Bdellovibrionota bacterium]
MKALFLATATTGLMVISAVFNLGFSSIAQAEEPALPRSEIITNYHWVGIFNIKFSIESRRRNYSTQILSLLVANRKEGQKLYAEVGEPTYTAPGIEKEYQLNGIKRFSGDLISTDIAEFLQGKELRFSIADFYFVGGLQNGTQSPIKGLIYEISGNQLAGYFELYPRHDGGDSYGFRRSEDHVNCFLGADSALKNPPEQCFGPGAP